MDDLPEGTQSLVLICHAPDVPSRADDVNRGGREVSSDLPRIEFIHGIRIDLPPQPAEIAEGEFSRGFTARGKPGPLAMGGARHGLNDYTAWQCRLIFALLHEQARARRSK